jgi:hypothetical protein
VALKLRINLRIDGDSIRTLDDLRDHFNIVDVLDFFRDGRLARWLEDKDTDLAERVKNIYGDDLHCAKALCDIFEVLFDVCDLQTDDYHTLIDDIISHKNDYEYLKNPVLKLFTKYRVLVENSTVADEIYKNLANNAPLSLFVAMTSSKLNIAFRQDIISKINESLFKNDSDNGLILQSHYAKPMDVPCDSEYHSADDWLKIALMLFDKNRELFSPKMKVFSISQSDIISGEYELSCPFFNEPVVVLENSYDNNYRGNTINSCYFYFRNTEKDEFIFFIKTLISVPFDTRVHFSYITLTDLESIVHSVSETLPKFVMEIRDCDAGKEIILISAIGDSKINVGAYGELSASQISGQFLKCHASDINCPADTRLLCAEVW